MDHLFSIFLAILALSFLVFIHELGHFWMARREGMRVEAFAIGFGRPLVIWMRDGVKWMICLLPFGGYVRIAGMQREGSKEPSEIADGFYGKRPLQRIRVALAGPVVNLLFALLVFTLLWICGGREKPLAEFTHRIGWVDPHSSLYERGIRPGDEISRYGGRAYNGFKDLLVVSLMNEKTVRIEGERVDERTGNKTPFDYTLSTYVNPQFSNVKMETVGVLAPASSLIFAGAPDPALIKESGIEPGDRIVWANGESLFSIQQLSHVVNRPTTFLTINRKGTLVQTNVPRVRLDDLRLTPYERAEVGDWQYEIGLKGKLQDLYFIPYSLSPDAIVERNLDSLDPKEAFAPSEFPLQEGDRIVAIDGMPVPSSYKLLEALQINRVLLIVERPTSHKELLWSHADAAFDDAVSRESLQKLVAKIGTKETEMQVGNCYRLQPIVPRQSGDRLILGLGLRDQEVIYNPNPLQQFAAVTLDTGRTLTALVSGTLNPKYMSGPVGIVHVVQQSWMIGFKEALFWLALISLNLGLVNLLPIPVLDGGHILLSVLEAIRRKPFQAKTMERLIIPFIGLLIVFFLYITYQDISRLFSKFF